MKGIYEASDVLIQELKNAGFNQVTFGNVQNIDLQKQNLMPLANIEVQSVELNQATANITFSVIVVDLVDDKALEKGLNNRTDNLPDVLHDLAARVRTVYNQFETNNSVNYKSSATFDLDAFEARFTNKLAGYEFTIGIQTIEQGC